jgi:uncharacterized protein YaiI (UPF0178 family)
VPAEQDGSAFVADWAQLGRDILCIQEERRVGNDNTVAWKGLRLQIPPSPLITRAIVAAGADAADDWIVEHVVAGDVVVTSDIPLAARVLAKGAHAIASYGRAFTGESIGLALAQRALMEHIRSTGETTGGPPPFSPKDRSRFLQALDQAIARELRKRSSSESR